MWVDSTPLGFARYMSNVSVSDIIPLSVVAVLKNFRMHTSTGILGNISDSLKNDCILPEKSRHAANSQLFETFLNKLPLARTTYFYLSAFFGHFFNYSKRLC